MIGAQQNCPIKQGVSKEESAAHIQAHCRGHLLRARFGGVSQCWTGATSLELSVCGSSTCRKQGSNNTLRALEDLVPAGVVTRSASCFGMCGYGPNVGVTSSDGCSSVENAIDPELAPDLLARFGIHVPSDLAQAVRMRVSAAQELLDGDLDDSESTLTKALRVLETSHIRSVRCLLLEHDLLLRLSQLHEKRADTERQLDTARRAIKVQDCLFRAHSSGPKRNLEPKAPRHAPALLLAGTACALLARADLASSANGAQGDPQSTAGTGSTPTAASGTTTTSTTSAAAKTPAAASQIAPSATGVATFSPVAPAATSAAELNSPRVLGVAEREQYLCEAKTLLGALLVMPKIGGGAPRIRWVYGHERRAAEAALASCDGV